MKSPKISGSKDAKPCLTYTCPFLLDWSPLVKVFDPAAAVAAGAGSFVRTAES